METIIVRSCIKPNLKRVLLLRGTAIAGIGVILLALSGSFIPPEHLRIWGFPIILVGGAMIAIGMLPYRRICRKEDVPDELRVLGEEYIQYRLWGKPVLTVPTKSIASMKHIEGGYRYGIAMNLRHPIPEKIVIHDPKFSDEKFHAQSAKRTGYDLFFPYFSRQGFTRIAFLELIKSPTE
ncbi:MAG: hypothetical protein H7A37_10430 [Chlamydiales bacterium]|nr:hypothetical protein [Chlamydiia bacterium]MCP5508693.1 hypothetical protein [Chlamydiales bacterium]